MTNNKKKYLFIYLNAFSGTGGIEKFNTCMMKSLYEYSLITNHSCNNISLIDKFVDKKYIPQVLLHGFNNKKIRAIIYACMKIIETDVIILGHTNLLVLGLWTLLFPNKKLLIMAHGIEVWQELSFWKKKVLQNCDMILAVSKYTKQQIMAKHQISETKIQIFHNTINPFFELPKSFEKSEYLLDRYKITNHINGKIFFTLARLSSAEQYKGYDKVLEAMPMVLQKYPTCKYVIAGKYDEIEYQRIQAIIVEKKLENSVILTGFVKDEELIDHYLLADTFIMPSRGEGFGIVYLEAMACGLSIIAGNADGSRDALRNGELGTLINPESVEEIANAMLSHIENPLNNNKKIKLQEKVMSYFGFENFKQRTAEIMGLV